MDEREVATVKAVFGAGVETLVDIGPRSTRPAAGIADQAKMRATVKACRECGPDRAPVVPAYPILNHRFVMVMSSPMTEDDRRFLTTAFRNSGLGRMDDIAIVNRVACAGTRGRNSAEELRNCHGHAIDSMWQANADHVLLVGGAAKDLWRPDLTVDQLEGHVGVMWDRYVAMVVGSPAAVMSMSGGRLKEERNHRLLNALREWANVVKGAVRSGEADHDSDPFILPPAAHMAKTCVGGKCQRRAMHMDRDGLGWCGGCWEAGGKQGWRTARGVSAQGEMF